jgi:electron transport complex protein RnfC
MTVKEFDYITDEISPLTNTICLHLMGEPLLHPNIKEIFEICNSKNLAVYLTTNGTLLKQNLELLKTGCAKRISVSLHSFEANTNPNSLDDYLEKVLSSCKEIADSATEGEKVKVMALKSQYPQGAEKMIIQSATGRKMPPGKLPSDVGCVVMNVASIAFIGRYVATGKPLVSRSMTIDGSAIKTPKNVRVPIGTMMDYIVDYCGGFTEEPEKIVCGGPMMGSAITNINYPILKGNNALLAFKKGDLSIKKETDCIRCGRCAAACPLNLVPTNIEKFTKIGDVAKLKHSGAMVCMECGSCAYNCPAKRPLVQSISLAKAKIKEMKNNGK